jgi:hypothetical protein
MNDKTFSEKLVESHWNTIKRAVEAAIDTNNFSIEAASAFMFELGRHYQFALLLDDPKRQCEVSALFHAATMSVAAKFKRNGL